MSTAIVRQMQTLYCTRCANEKGHVEPDFSEFGIFNLNNRNQLSDCIFPWIDERIHQPIYNFLDPILFLSPANYEIIIYLNVLLGCLSVCTSSLQSISASSGSNDWRPIWDAFTEKMSHRWWLQMPYPELAIVQAVSVFRFGPTRTQDLPVAKRPMLEPDSISAGFISQFARSRSPSGRFRPRPTRDLCRASDIYPG